MNELTLTQEFALCVLNEKGTYSAWATEVPVCLVGAALLELEMANCIEIIDKKVTVLKPLSSETQYLQSFYDYLNGGKSKKLETVAGDYAMSFSGARLGALQGSVNECLVQANVVDKKMGGVFGKKALYVPHSDSVDRIIQKIRAELLENGELTDEVVVLTTLLEQCNHLKIYFSKYELKQLKQRVKEIKETDSFATVKQMTDYITTMMVIIAVS